MIPCHSSQHSLLSQRRVQVLQQRVGASAELAVAFHAVAEPIHQSSGCGGSAAIHAFSGREAESAGLCRQCAEVRRQHCSITITLREIKVNCLAGIGRCKLLWVTTAGSPALKQPDFTAPNSTFKMQWLSASQVLHDRIAMGAAGRYVMSFAKAVPVQRHRVRGGCGVATGSWARGWECRLWSRA